MNQVLHMAIYNIMGNDFDTGHLGKNWMYGPPGNPTPNTPNVYAFMVFETDGDVPIPTTTDVPNPFVLQSLLTFLGANINIKLVALNYFKAYGVIYSKYAMMNYGVRYTNMAPTFGVLGDDIPCSWYTNMSSPSYRMYGGINEYMNLGGKEVTSDQRCACRFQGQHLPTTI